MASTDSIMQTIGMWASIAMPLFNIPLVVRIIKRRSSADISLTWALGVYSCILLMCPYGLQSTDIVLKAFTYSNTVLFSLVVLASVWFRLKKYPAQKPAQSN